MGAVIPFPRSPERVVAHLPQRTDLGGYRAAMKYAEVVLICKRALSAITLGSSPEAARIARQTLEWTAENSEWPQARSLASAYLRYVGRGAPS